MQIDDEVMASAVDGLAFAHPKQSAKYLLAKTQIIVICGVFAIMGILAAIWPIAAFIALNIVTAVYFISAIFFRIFLLALGRNAKVTDPELSRPDDDDLPVITILLPLYKDAAALPMLARAIGDLDYPHSKKDVKLLLEADDVETIMEAIRLKLDLQYELIVIPHAEPRTKPKACNVGLQFAQGELIVIYDAEDLPESDQLRKAAAAFEGSDDKLACVQARLNYYNRTDNWLTRMFTLEYSLWFDWLLPALQKMGAPIPLGGTSNFFRTQTLIKSGGWDPYNVTEDADLGLRLARLGYRVELIASTTFEEANCCVKNWVRQRSRWIKGYLQTWLVHMRSPQQIIRTTGWRGFLAVQLFVAGNVFSALINPLMWVAFFGGALLLPELSTQLIPKPLFYLNMFALIFGNFFFMAMLMIGPRKRGWKDLSAFAMTAPAYWLLTSFAAYKGLWQAIIRPHYWEKTHHVISEAARQKRDEALIKHFTKAPEHKRPEYAAAPFLPARRSAFYEDERPWQ